MSNKGKLLWLASYPKSGNTWFRIFLSNLLQEQVTAADINNLESAYIASGRSALDFLYGIDSTLLSQTEIDKRRPKVYDHWVDQIEANRRFHKVHDAYSFLPDGTPLLGNPKQQAAIYLVRNPLDVAVSLAHHSAYKDVHKGVVKVNDPDMAFCHKADNFSNQLRQHLSSWSQHISSWIDNADMPIYMMRYEDMVNDPLNTFRQAVVFAGLEYSDDEILEALDKAAFDKLQAQENEAGFQEKMAKAKSFFRKGKVGSYTESLTEGQIRMIIETHAEMMKRLGYMTANGVIALG